MMDNEIHGKSVSNPLSSFKSKVIPVIMAGGLGKRMNSTLPKVVHSISHKPMIVHVIETVRRLHPEKILIIVGKFKEIIEHHIGKFTALHDIEFVIQREPLGTGHAMQCVLPVLQNYPGCDVLTLSGDVPFVSDSILSSLLDTASENPGYGAVITCSEFEDPTGYGRIIKSYGSDTFEKIVEQKDCTVEQAGIALVNCGVYLFANDSLQTHLPCIHNHNASEEYYLTDVFQLINESTNAHGSNVLVFQLPKSLQWMLQGVNTPEQLAELETRFICENDVGV